jgi:hypothetical protein
LTRYCTQRFYHIAVIFLSNRVEILLIFFAIIIVSYQKSKRCGKVGYEEELMAYLTTVVAEADKRIQRGCERLQMQAQETAVVS